MKQTDGGSAMRWRHLVSLAVILIPATLLTVACTTGLHPDPDSARFVNSRRDP